MILLGIYVILWNQLLRISIVVMYCEIGFCCEWNAYVMLFVLLMYVSQKKKSRNCDFLFHTMLLKTFCLKYKMYLLDTIATY
jgi:hypothetical protein